MSTQEIALWSKIISLCKFDEFAEVMNHFGYIQALTDHTLFLKYLDSAKILILIAYIDDIIITRDNLMEIKTLKLI